MIFGDFDNIKDIKGRLSRESEELTRALRERLFMLLGGAMGLVAALAWNDAVQSLFRKIFPAAGQDVAAKFAYAIAITTIVVYLTIKAEKILKK